MTRFMHHEFDVLVATTIIENGLDIPLANTLIVNRADRYGLSQLYQLRGRVGRSNRRAYAYLLIPSDETLTPIARRRLAAIREFSELGAASALPPWIWNCAAPEICWAASNTGTSRRSGSICIASCWSERWRNCEPVQCCRKSRRQSI